MFGLTPFEKSSYDLFDAFHSFENDFFGGNTLRSFKTDIKDMGDSYIMEAELPGFDKGDISLDISGSTLTLSAEHKAENSEKDGSGNYVRRERTFGSYQRSFDISGIDADKMEAEYKNGILCLTMPKLKKTEPSVRRLEIR